VTAYAQLFGTSAHCAGAIGMMADWDLVPLKRDLPKLTVPMLVLHGEKDAAIQVSGALDSVALIPGCELEVLPNLGHLAHEEAPSLVVDRIIGFAASHAIPVDVETIS
jgi:magnesium chelatase accessory protein